jgi:acetoin utilization deacetylase AcuC-like enzyme
LAAGGVVNAADAVARGEAGRAFCAVRPPGHHAERSNAMGFCFFNNVAIAAEYLRHQHGIERIAILDWDVHHGNGTQHYFEADPNVFFCSIHQHPDTLYPGTGYAEERGTGAGMGATLNVPMAPGSGDEEYRRAFETTILPALDRFRPEFLLISAGFDAHRADPLGHIKLSTEMFGWMTLHAMELARRHCGGRIVSVLEGGYDLTALADSVQAHLEVLAVSE